MSEQFTLSSEQAKALHETFNPEMPPGSILHDMEVVLNYIGPEGVPAGGKHHLLPIAAIPVLDPLLHRPLRLSLKRPQLKSHPYLQGLHGLGRASGLTVVQGSGEKARLCLGATVHASYQALNPTERYFALLCAFLFEVDSEMVGEGNRFTSSPVIEHLGMVTYFATPEPPIDRIIDSYRLLRSPFQHALMELFGLVEHPTPLSSSMYEPPQDPRLTPFGHALFISITNWLSACRDRERNEPDEKADSEEEGDDGSEDWLLLAGHLQQVLQPAFPDWQRHLEFSPPTEAVEGVYIFKVSLSKTVWRRIAIPGDLTISALVSQILNAFAFDHDHLYSLYFRDEKGRQVQVVHPQCDEGNSADDIAVCDAPFRIGEPVRLTYDFGDNWKFQIVLERIDTDDPKIKRASVLQTVGKAPQQYPDWD